MIEIWEGKSSGILREDPLLLKAAKSGVFGSSLIYPKGAVYQALFTYLCGMPDEEFFHAHSELFCGTYLVCMSKEWEDFIRRQSIQVILRRTMMKPRLGASSKQKPLLPPGYTISLFTPEIFDAHPFGHGTNYQSFEDFRCRGSGAAVCYEGKIVSSASSFMTFGQDVELDVSTEPEHRKKNLAHACVHRLMEDCAKRNLVIHWDAQNPASQKMALAHGFEEEQSYAVYILQQKTGT